MGRMLEICAFADDLEEAAGTVEAGWLRLFEL
jgi:hypothetical protein